MKKNLACILAVILCCCAACAAAETAFVIPRPSYEDGTGVSFVFPEGWLIERPDWEDRTFPFSQVLKVKWPSAGNGTFARLEDIPSAPDLTDATNYTDAALAEWGSYL